MSRYVYTNIYIDIYRYIWIYIGPGTRDPGPGPGTWAGTRAGARDPGKWARNPGQCVPIRIGARHPACAISCSPNKDVPSTGNDVSNAILYR